MIVYLTINKINGKMYVGQDSKNDSKYFGSGVIIKRALKKYGKENFKKEVLKKCANFDELNKYEKLYIKEYNTLYPFGYNLTTGGDNGYEISDTTKKKISVARMGMKPSKEARIKMSISHLKRWKSMSNKEKRKLSLVSKENWLKFKNEKARYRDYIKTCSEKMKGDKNPMKDLIIKEKVRKKVIERLSDPKNNPMYGVSRFGEENPLWGKTILNDEQCYDVLSRREVGESQQSIAKAHNVSKKTIYRIEHGVGSYKMILDKFKRTKNETNTHKR